MDIAQTVALIRRWWWLLLIAMVVGGGAAYSFTSRTSATYQATSTLLVFQQQVPGAIQLNDLQTSERLASTFARLVTLRPVLEDAIEIGQLDITPEQLKGRLSVSNPPDTNLLEITSTAGRPSLARDLANLTSEAFIQSEEARIASDAGEVRVIERAVTPTIAQGQPLLINAFMGAVVGLILAVAGALLAERLDDRIRGTHELRAIGRLTPLGFIRRFRPRSTVPVVVSQPDSRTAEEFRSLRTSVLSRIARLESPVIEIASPGTDDGKTTIATNLAVALGLTGRRTITVDADLRSPSVHEVFGLEREGGLTDLLLDVRDIEANIDRLITPSEYPNLDILTAGRSASNPSELLGSAAMATVVGVLKERYDVIILDSSPMLRVTDALVMAQLADAIVLAVRPGETRRRELRAVYEDLTQAGHEPLGVVMNQVGRLDLIGETASPGLYGVYES